MALLSGLVPVPPEITPESSVFDLKQRLDWGEPALTIVDVRDREAFNYSRITGAISIPLEQLAASAPTSFESDRDIYVYGANDDETASAFNLLKEMGFQNVAKLIGGMEAWQAAGYPLEKVVV
ncbi:rhodanese-like domain-containing protein [Vacuolonema iberomarrocanum]|uniref:rhodanese-like domain-containing protein n=1 Tax=Vacuolonema iberomarrocanum TaxID=3454632 RepID=UPI0019F00050|nr:rhodanese-like domain-containing protein [filamentous cyanobacterium LEGE 07170]